MAEVVVLDTDMDSRLSEPELWAWARAWLERRNLIYVTAPTVIERRYGYQSAFSHWKRLWETYVELLAAGTVGVLPLDFEAAEIAGHLRAVCPVPKIGRRRRRSRSKAVRRVSWILDILIAATSARHGYPLFTANGEDFQFLREKLGTQYRLDLVVYPALP
jgi:predicted nucleic acid-binding protein